MDDFVDVTVSCRGRKISAGCYKMPVSIGRGEHNAVRIGHDPQDKTISRTHAILQRSGQGIRLVDKSSNGTTYRGARLRQGSSIDLKPTDHFEVFEFTFDVEKARRDPSVPVLFEAHVLVDGYRKGEPFQVGEMLLLCFKRKRGYRFDQAPVRADLETILSYHRIEDEHAFAAIVGYRGGGILATQPVGDRPTILKNKQPVREPQVELRSRDVIEIDNIRIELYPPGENSLKCSNPACGLLNPYEPNGNCRFCSFGLIGAVTRAVTPAQKPKG
ncbi:FHA domain-containing protein [Bradyrhizobium sp. 180]|uniref:FHA domain-containing protein n=1 Tax=Bradyrhizobium sp. 180 TaxID=2782650 RepID=UPI001FFA4AAE|nr:FHA domain-containing protein [Bradyrhizobium sp. 180]MCK1489745.1 FHA domain-containing protein [Bradyrhizobium sp. 180]